jgi:hypothetical protein
MPELDETGMTSKKLETVGHLLLHLPEAFLDDSESTNFPLNKGAAALAATLYVNCSTFFFCWVSEV